LQNLNKYRKESGKEICNEKKWHSSEKISRELLLQKIPVIE
jgi:hypothetical protein